MGSRVTVEHDTWCKLRWRHTRRCTCLATRVRELRELRRAERRKARCWRSVFAWAVLYFIAFGIGVAAAAIFYGVLCHGC